MGLAPNWTTEELEFLEDKWGQASIKTIAKHLNRSVTAIKIKAQRRGLKDNRFCMSGITLSQLSVALNTHYGIVRSWVGKFDFPARPRVMAVTSTVLVVQYVDFWKWANAHRDLVNFARLEPNLLGPEPDWAKEKRKYDTVNFNKMLKRVWLPEEDKQLKSMVHAYHFTYPEIARALKRSEAAIKRRLDDLGIKARPVRLPNHIKWTDAEVKMLVEMLHKGYGYNTMADHLGKSALAVRGKLERMGYKFRSGKSIQVQ